MTPLEPPSPRSDQKDYHCIQQQQQWVTHPMAVGPDSLQMLKSSAPSPRGPGETEESNAHVHTCRHTYVHTQFTGGRVPQVHTSPASASFGWIWVLVVLFLLS